MLNYYMAQENMLALGTVQQCGKQQKLLGSEEMFVEDHILRDGSSAHKSEEFQDSCLVGWTRVDSKYKLIMLSNTYLDTNIQKA